MSKLGLYEYFGIVAPELDQDGHVKIDDFRFVCASKYNLSLLKDESNDILAD